MNHTYKFLLVFIFSCILFSCKNNEEKKPVTVTEKIQEKELYNTGTTTCKLNGEVNEIHSQGIMTDSQTGMQSCIADNDNCQIQIIFPKTLAEGQSSNNCKGMVMTKKPMLLYNNVISSTVIITKRTDKMVAGTFSFDANTYAGSKETIKVTEGKFEAEILN